MYRTLCEALRVKRAWSDCGFEESPFAHFRRKHYGQLRWLRLAIRSLESNEQVVRRSIDGVDDGEESYPLSPSLSRWIAAETKFFDDAIREKRNKSNYTQNLVRMLYLGGVVCSAIAAYLTWRGIESAVLEPAVVAMGAFPGIAALMIAFAEREGWEDDVDQYEYISTVFNRAASATTSMPAKSLAFELGRELLHHNGDWLCVNLSRPLEPPTL